MNDEHKKQIELTLAAASGLNGGHGMIVPRAVATLLKENGITGKYIVGGESVPGFYTNVEEYPPIHLWRSKKL